MDERVNAVEENGQTQAAYAGIDDTAFGVTFLTVSSSMSSLPAESSLSSSSLDVSSRFELGLVRRALPDDVLLLFRSCLLLISPATLVAGVEASEVFRLRDLESRESSS